MKKMHQQQQQQTQQQPIPDIELHLLELRLSILTIKKCAIKNLMYTIIKLAFTNKTKCSFFSFIETTNDYTIIVDQYGFNEFNEYIDNMNIIKSKSRWIPMYLTGEDLPGSMSISKIAKYIILPLADYSISIMAISMYQCDYILIQECDLNKVIKCLSSHIPYIYDESKSHRENLCLKKDKYSSINDSDLVNNDFSQNSITLPLIIPDNAQYCITGVYNEYQFALIMPTLIGIMFYETESYNDEEIFFNLTRKQTDISIVMQKQFIPYFPSEIIQNVEENYWRLIRIGQYSLGMQYSGVCAQVSSPLEKANIDEYYISSYHTGYCFIPENMVHTANEYFLKRNATILTKIPTEEFFESPQSQSIDQQNADTSMCSNGSNGHNDNALSMDGDGIKQQQQQLLHHTTNGFHSTL